MKSKDMISRIIVFLLLVFTVSPMFKIYSTDRYNSGKNLTKKEYIENFEQSKKELLSYKNSTAFPYSLTVTFLGLLIIVGGYELVVFVVKTLITSKSISKF
ncbi:MAG: hypothetical protein WBM86_00150 [Waterburya sp.]